MLDVDGYAELVATKPFLYHRAWNADDTALGSILSNGLERVRTNYAGYWASRPDHVYMGTRAHALSVKPRQDDDGTPWALLRIDVSVLERRRIDPDEDHFLTHNWVGGEITRRQETACRRGHVPFPPSQWVWEWARYLSIPFPNLGEWADQVGLGANPKHTRWSMANGRLSYRGVIPPTALTVVSTTWGSV
jgi:hypothetical protein